MHNKSNDLRIDRSKKRKAPTPTQERVLEIATKHPKMSLRDIGKLAECSHVSVMDTLKKYGVDKEDAERFRKHRADIFMGLQGVILEQQLTVAGIKNMNPQTAALWFNSLYNNERLERGQSTSNISSISTIIQEIESKKQPNNDKD